MKTLMRLFTLALVLVVAGGGWFVQSVHFSLMELREGAVAGDLARVERYADLDKVAASMLELPAAMAAVSAEDAAGDIGKALIEGLAGIVKGSVSAKAQRRLAEEMRATIAGGRALEIARPFKPKELPDALEGVTYPREGIAVVRIRGTCEGHAAVAPVRFIRAKHGPLALIPTWKAVGFDTETLPELARACLGHGPAPTE